MRLLAFFVAIVVLFALTDPSVAQEAAAPSAKALGLRLLTWPGKVAAPAPVRSASTPAATARPAASAPALPTSIYDPAPARPASPARAAPAPQALAQAQVAPSPAAYPGVRFYSLHRDYGQQPDPVSLSPQFLSSASPDLAAPPPEPPRTVTTSTGQVRMIAPDDPAGPAPGSN